MDSDSSDTNLVITTKRVRLKLFFKLYWKIFVLILTPFLLLPIYLTAESDVYKSFYVFTVTTVYWITDVMHPGIISLVPITLYTLIGSNMYLNLMLPIGSELFDCLCIMIVIAAIENSELNRRIAIKLLLVFGCSHYRLSFMLFSCTMFMSMMVSDVIACGLMMPLLKAMLVELEKMGILEMHLTVASGKHTADYHDQLINPKPTDFTVFYFLGIAYSASIGGMATLIGSQSNQIFKMYSESMFPLSPKIEFPHIVLLNLPGVLLMEALIYVWMNSYFLGMFRSRNDISLQIGLSEEEAQYISTLLEMQYTKLGTISFHQSIVGVIVLLVCVLQLSFSYSYIQMITPSNLSVSAPSMLSVILLFIIPVNLEFLKFFKRHVNEPLPTSSSKSCLNWNLVKTKVHWSVLFILVSSDGVFSTLRQSKLLDSVAAWLPWQEWPAPVLALLTILLCKPLGELASNATAAYCLLPSVAKLSIASSVNPHYLMLAAAMACSLPFHLVTGSPVNSMVAAYVQIPQWKMMCAGVGPSVIAMVAVWFTVAVWSKAIWMDIHAHPMLPHQPFNITT